ncbi:MAG: ATP-grasp domain-containing protein [Promethearchaeota archaeon]
MMEIRLILTSVGGLVAPSMIKSLKKYFKDIYIVGLDTSENAVGFHFADAHYLVPYGNDPEYASKLLEIAIKEKINFIIPGSDEETLALAKNKKKFESNDIKPLCSDYEKCEIAFNKGKMLDFLKIRGIKTPKFRLPTNHKQFLNYAKELGYPEKKIVLKPTISRGARGFWVLDANFDEQYGLLKDRDRQTTKLENVSEILLKSKLFPSIILMEYLEGEDFNIEVLAKDGDVFYIIPHIRLVPKAGPVQVGYVKEDYKINKLIKKIVKVFEFDFYLNIEVAYNIQKNIPMIYEINARIGAPIVITAAAGINLLAKGIELAMGIPIKKNLKVQETMMIRYWNELFIKKNRYFNS